MMGVDPIGMSGVPLADAMLHPSKPDIAKQKSVTARLQPVVSALKREATLEVQAGL
jgi:hypothetical protein